METMPIDLYKRLEDQRRVVAQELYPRCHKRLREAVSSINGRISACF
jgi:hypothetical protein